MREGLLPEFRHRRGRQAARRKTPSPATSVGLPTIPEPALPVTERPWGIVVAGVGGTGVDHHRPAVRHGRAHRGQGVVTQDAGGLAQKGGATWSHIQIAARPEAIRTTKVDTAQADLVIACDAIVGAMKYTMTVMQHGRTTSR